MGTGHDYSHYVDVDMVLDYPKEMKASTGMLSVQGPVRDTIRRYGLSSKVIQEQGPGGGNPVVRLHGSRLKLEQYLINEHDDEDREYCSRIQRRRGEHRASV